MKTVSEIQGGSGGVRTPNLPMKPPESLKATFKGVSYFVKMLKRIILPGKSLETPNEFNVFSFILTTIDVEFSH